MDNKPTSQPRRLFYNLDAWSPFYRGQSPAAIRVAIERLAGSQVTAVMLSSGIGQSVNYPSEVSEMCHWRPLQPEVRAELYRVMGEQAAGGVEGVAELYRREGTDCFGVLVEAVVRSGRQAFATMRMNDTHMVTLEGGQGPYTDAFYRAHPEWRLRDAGLNYAVPEVRAHRLAMMEELLRRYPFTGLELDFLRGPPFFPSSVAAAVGPSAAKKKTGEEAERWTEPGANGPHFPRDLAEGHAPVMTEFLENVRRMTRRVGEELGRRIELCVRVPSSLSGCRRVGLDPVAWHARGCLDFLTVGKFLQLVFALPVADFKRALPGLPVHASIDYVVGGPLIDGYFHPRDATAEIYRGAAASLYAQGADGLTLFNMFAAQCNGCDPAGRNWNHEEPLGVLGEMGDPATLEEPDKLYLVDAAFTLFDRPFFDGRASLPAAVTPDAPLLAALFAGDRNSGGKRCTLRVVLTAAPEPGAMFAVQVNGILQGPARAAERSHLFSEPYDQKSPELECVRDFAVRSADLKFGANEIAVLVSVPVTVASIELAVEVVRGIY
jgi:hypothetical protein